MNYKKIVAVEFFDNDTNKFVEMSKKIKALGVQFKTEPSKFWYFDTQYVRTTSFNVLMDMFDNAEINLRHGPKGQNFTKDDVEQLRDTVAKRNKEYYAQIQQYKK